MLPLAFRGPTSRFTAADLIERRAAARGKQTFARFEGRAVSYASYNSAANRIAHWALDSGLGCGDVVALVMENRTEYLETWAGLAKAGITTALVNTQLEGRSLAHVLEAADARRVIVGAECLERWKTLGRATPYDDRLFVAADPGAPEAQPLPPGASSLDKETARFDDTNPPRAVRAELRGGDPLFYIYTSGTTGLPKAARFSHARWMGGGMYALLAGFGKHDTFYCPLPLYHTVGGVMAVNAVLASGGTLALARSFSASRFWDDITEMGATAFQYIGELPRYLLEQPERENERRHSVRFCVGNGLRAEVWERFQRRFGIPHIVEFYGATESNISMVNFDDKVGSAGKPAPGMKAALVRYDVQRAEHVREPGGALSLCDVGEPGELIGRISQGRTAAGRFEGYTSKEASDKKILHDVLAPGDAWFSTGDLMRRDADGFYYFVDRIGDSFRWKGENVSTQEVADAICEVPSIELCAVYGVEIPGADGRAGMAAIQMQEGAAADAKALYVQVTRSLPSFARPAFVRVLESADLTATFKIRKVELQREGFEPTGSSDVVLYKDDEAGSYMPLSRDVLDEIRSGERRF
jgi:fatty-acyl-CoA synthase